MSKGFVNDTYSGSAGQGVAAAVGKSGGPAQPPSPLHKPEDPCSLARACTDRALRDRWHLGYVEGVAPFVQACAAGVKFDALIWSPTLLQSSRAQKLLRRKRATGVPTKKVTPEAFRDLARAPRASGIAGVFRQRWRNLANVEPGRGLCWLAVERIRSDGNLGTILRALEASSAAGLIVIGSGVDPYALEPIRASMGAVFHLDLVRTSLRDFSEWATRQRVDVVGTSPEAELNYRDHAYPSRTVLVLGEERRGISPAVSAACTSSVRIPILGRGDSLNVGVAAGVLLYEVLRQRDPGAG